MVIRFSLLDFKQSPIFWIYVTNATLHVSNTLSMNFLISWSLIVKFVIAEWIFQDLKFAKPILRNYKIVESQKLFTKRFCV